MLQKQQLYDEFKEWVEQFATHHPNWEPNTIKTYITDAHRILFTDDCLPGCGYRTVWNYIHNVAPESAHQLDKWVTPRFRDKKSDCL